MLFWFLVDPAERGREERLYRIVGTGHPLPARFTGREFVGTVQAASGLVWHVFGGER